MLSAVEFTHKQSVICIYNIPGGAPGVLKILYIYNLAYPKF